MTTIVFSNQKATRAIATTTSSTLIISHAMTDSGDEFAYRFTKNEIVTHEPIQNLSIILDARLKSGSDAYIDSFVCTNRPPIQVKSPAIDEDGRFPEGSQQVDFELRMKSHEFIFLGIIVGIKVNGVYEFILCDPQVGNGPPNGDRAIRIS